MTTRQHVWEEAYGTGLGTGIDTVSGGRLLVLRIEFTPSGDVVPSGIVTNFACSYGHQMLVVKNAADKTSVQQQQVKYAGNQVWDVTRLMRAAMLIGMDGSV